MRKLVLGLLLSVFVVAVHAQDDDVIPWIAYTTQTDEGAILALVDADDPDNQRTLATCNVLCVFPTWSADGLLIGYMDDDHLIVIDLDGTVQSRVTVDRGSYAYNVIPTWNDDLTRVVYAGRFDTQTDIIVVDMTTGEAAIVPEIDSAQAPLWLDENTIGFTMGRRITTLDLDTFDQETITPVGDRHDLPAWSPDGEQIALRVQVGEDYALALMNADSRNGRIVFSGLVEQPIWSPDGEQIAVVLWRGLSGVRTDVVVVPAMADAMPQTVAVVDVTRYTPTWSPDSARLAYIGVIDPEADDPVYGLFVSMLESEPMLLVDAIADAIRVTTRPAWRPQ